MSNTMFYLIVRRGRHLKLEKEIDLQEYISSPEKRIEDKTFYEQGRNVKSAIYRIKKFIDRFDLSWAKYRKKIRPCL